jgi:hypothetical protein
MRKFEFRVLSITTLGLCLLVIAVEICRNGGKYSPK